MRIDISIRFKPVLGSLILAAAFSMSCSTGRVTMTPLVSTEDDIEREQAKEELSRAGSTTSLPLSAKAHFDFILGELALSQEDFDAALAYFSEAAKYEPSSAPVLRKRLAELYLRNGKLDAALEQVNRGLEGDEDNLDLLKLKAGILATQKKNPEAIAVYKEIISLGEGKEEEAYVFIATLYAQQGNTGAAKDVLKQLIAKSPSSFFGSYYLAKVLLGSGEFAEAEKYLKRALELNSEAEIVQLDLARLYAFQKRFTEAGKICEEIIGKNPGNVKARELLGEILLGKDKVDEAIKEFEAIGAMQEDPSETRLKIALLKLQRRNFDGAEVELRLVLTEHPENSAARYYLGSVYAAMRRSEDAVAQLKAIKPDDKYFAESRTLGAYLLRQMDRYKEAIDLMNELAGKQPNDVKVLSFLAALQRDAKDYNAAIETTKKIIEIDPKDDRNYFTLGVYYDDAKNKQEAMNSMRKAVELNEKNANALNYLGYSLAEQGQQLDEAEQLIRRALEVEKDNGYFIDSLGWLYYQRGKYEEALVELERAVQIVPQDAVILEHLGLVLDKVGQKERAISTLKKALEFAPQSDDTAAEERIRRELKELE